MTITTLQCVYIIIFSSVCLLGIFLLRQIGKLKKIDALDTGRRKTINLSIGLTVAALIGILAYSFSLFTQTKTRTRVDDIVARGEQQQKDGKLHDAIESYLQANRVDPKYELIHNFLGKAYFQAGDYSKAEAEFRAFLVDWPDDPPAHYNLGNALEKEGKAGEAKVEWKKALDLHPDDDLVFSIKFKLFGDKK